MPEALRDPPICIRLPPALDARLRRKVEAEASTITDYVRGLIEQDLPAPDRKPIAVKRGRTRMVAPRNPGLETGGSNVKAGGCTHRMPPGSFCKRCARIV